MGLLQGEAMDNMPLLVALAVLGAAASLSPQQKSEALIPQDFDMEGHRLQTAQGPAPIPEWMKLCEVTTDGGNNVKFDHCVHMPYGCDPTLPEGVNGNFCTGCEGNDYPTKNIPGNYKHDASKSMYDEAYSYYWPSEKPLVCGWRAESCDNCSKAEPPQIFEICKVSTASTNFSYNATGASYTRFVKYFANSKCNFLYGH